MAAVVVVVAAAVMAANGCSMGQSGWACVVTLPLAPAHCCPRRSTCPPTSPLC